MGPEESKSYQLRVRVTAEEHDFLEKLCKKSAHGETISDLVRRAIALLRKSGPDGKGSVLTSKTQERIERLAVLLKREPQQVEEACVEGILDLIDKKCDVPLIVMETHLHQKYRGKEDK